MYINSLSLYFLFNRKITRFYKLIFKYTLLALIFIYPLNLVSENSETSLNAINIKNQIKLIDQNIEFIKHNHKNNSNSSLALAKQTLDLAKKNNYLHGINNCYYNIALIHKINNNTDSASHYYIEGLEYDIIDKDLYAYFLGDLAEILILTGNPSSSLERSLTLQALIESNQTKKNAYQVYNLLALNYMELLQYNLALINFTKSVKIALLHNNEAYTGIIYSNIGQLFYTQNKFIEALKYFEKGTILEEKYKLFINLGNSYNIIADIYLKLNKLDSALFYLKKGKAINIKSNNKRGLAKTYYEYSEFDLKKNKVDSAIFYLNKTISIASKQNENTLLKEAYLSLSEIYAKKNNFEKAYYYHDLFFFMHSIIFNVENINKTKKLEHKLIQQKNKNEIVELELKKQKTIKILLVVVFSIVILASIIIAIYLIKFKKLNKELILSKEKAEESDILKSEFLKTISHEIRTPLNGIIGFTDLIISKELSKKELKDIQQYIFKSSQELTSTIENVVEMAHLSSKQYQVHKTDIKVSLLFKKITNQINDGFLYNHSKNIALDIDLNDEIEIYSDINILRKIILQLVKNALIYTEKGKIIIGCYKEKTKIIFYVKDTGIGIRKEKLDVIFSPFRQVGDNTNIKNGGIGLGLTIVKEFIFLLNGEIWVDSEIKKGSTFFISLPNK